MPGPDGEFVACDGAVSMCTTCRTDYEISITWMDSRGWVISIMIFRQFGDCRSPFDLAWMLMADEGGQLGSLPQYSNQRDLTSGVPTPRDRWIQDETAHRASTTSSGSNSKDDDFTA
jgi:hypothetical protein